jgi:hypothetical protein
VQKQPCAVAPHVQWGEQEDEDVVTKNYLTENSLAQVKP